MKLWTYHSETVPLDDPSFQYDPTKGMYWNSTERAFIYREVLTELQRHLKAELFLWCCTTPDSDFKTNNHRSDRMEWEVEIPMSDVLAFIDADTWEAIVRPNGKDWRSLFASLHVSKPTEEMVQTAKVDALVKLPLSPPASIRRVGLVPIGMPRAVNAAPRWE